MPHVIDEASDFALWHVDDNRSRLGQIEEADDVGRSCIGRQDAALANEVVVDDDIARLGTEDFLISLLPVGHANDRQRPEVGLRGPLEVTFVIKFGDRGVARIAALEFKVSDSGRDSFCAND